MVEGTVARFMKGERGGGLEQGFEKIACNNFSHYSLHLFEWK